MFSMNAALLVALIFCSNELFVQSQECAWTKCEDKGMVAVKSSTRPYSNGCSVPSFIQLPDFKFEKCCDSHDACYQACGASKNDCERDFQKCLKAHCNSRYKGNGECKKTAQTFVTGVKMFGCNGYQESQAIACDCVSRSKADSRNSAVLRKFYDRFNSSKTDEDIGTVVKKNKGKEGTMWRALFNKYPEAIEVISRDGQAQTPSGKGSEL